jgi:DNA-binding transcriptional LysR family regulator
MDRLLSMRVFQRVVEEGGFAAAARKLDLDPAVVTRLVADLEKHLGSRLLQRTTRRFALTPEGSEYLSRLQPLLAGIDEAEAMLRGQTSELRGRLRILAPPVVCTHLLAPAITEFQAKHPEIQVEVRSLDMADPPLEDYDITFLSSTAALPADVVTHLVGSSEAVLCASPDYIKRRGGPKAPSDLHEHRLLHLKLAGARSDRLKLLNPVDGTEELLDISPAVISDSADTLLRATLEGAGISSQSRDMLAPHVRRGLLQEVLAPWITARLSLFAAYPSRQFLPARARVFLEDFTVYIRESVLGPGTRANRD